MGFIWNIWIIMVMQCMKLFEYWDVIGVSYDNGDRQCEDVLVYLCVCLC